MKEAMILMGIKMVMGFLTPDLLLKLVGSVNTKIDSFVLPDND